MGEAESEAWSAVSSLLAGIAVLGGIGLGLDRLFGTHPILLILGVLAGNFLGVYLIFARHRAAADAAPPPPPAVAGWSKATPVPHTAPQPHPRAPELAQWPNVMHADDDREAPHAS